MRLLACILLTLIGDGLFAQPCACLIDTGYLTERQYWAHTILYESHSKEPQTFTQKHKIITTAADGRMTTLWVTRQYGQLYLFGGHMHSDSLTYFIPPRNHGSVLFIFTNGDNYRYDALLKHPVISFSALLQGSEKTGYRPKKNAYFKWPKKINADTVLLHKLQTQLLQQIQYTQQYIEDSAGSQVLRNTRPVTINYTEEEALKLQQVLRCLQP